MEIFVNNFPHQSIPTHEKALRRILKPPLRSIGIKAFEIHLVKKSRSGYPYAFLTLPTPELGEYFLSQFAVPPNNGYGRRNQQPLRRISLLNRYLTFRKSNKSENDYDWALIKLLQQEQGQTEKPTENKRSSSDRLFNIHGMECGLWSLDERIYVESPKFISYWNIKTDGKLHVGKYTVGMRITLENGYKSSTASPNSSKMQIVIDYNMVQKITVDSNHRGGPAMFVTLISAPRFFKLGPTLEDQFAGLSFSLGDSPGQHKVKKEKVRVSSLGGEHAILAPFCFVYKFHFESYDSLERMVRFSNIDGVPAVEKMASVTYNTIEIFEASFSKLNFSMQEFDFDIRFQLTVLLSGSLMPPDSIVQLIDTIRTIESRRGSRATAEILRCFSDELTTPSARDPENFGVVWTMKFLRKRLLDIEKKRSAELLRAIREREENGNLTTIHHVYVTPAGCYFHGPTVETLNRVLRKYEQYHEYFLRVTFADEDGASLHYERDVDLSEIYARFKSICSENNGIIVGGRVFSFLGFSGSSLRLQSCWFMAPFITEKGETVTARSLIAGLGDFSHIENAGRCAARIGQAFSNTRASIKVPHQAINDIEDVMREEYLDGKFLTRVFSDGCGTISLSLLERIWETNDNYKERRPTVLQIRYAGAKGVLSLDSTLSGEIMNLRRSMVKFRSDACDLEICSAATRPLPMYLNRPLIKILEDLHVPDEVFLNLQRMQIRELQLAARSPGLTPHFLENNNISSRQLGLPKIIRMLNSLKFSYTDDAFLSHAVELALLTVLRDIKYKSRIEIPGSYSLMGCMDETGFLEEGQVFVQIDTDQPRGNHGEVVKGVLQGPIVITRSPCMHPGDVQLAEAIAPPRNSPLRNLYNCVVFSQKGRRDLPSQLSGGDLDGDLYNVILDMNFRPRRLATPASHPRVSEKKLGRAVEVADMVDFYIDFMQNDHLGLISTRHLMISDIYPEGTFHIDSLKCSSLAAVAVDFPKTGVMAPLDQLPRAPRARPDFLAPGPRIVLEKNRARLGENDRLVMDEDDDEAEDSHAHKYYESEKILGKLFREINEENFLREINFGSSKGNLLPQILRYARKAWRYYKNVEDAWKFYLEEASQIKEMYEDQLFAFTKDYAQSSHLHTLQEVEVFIGCIVGKGRASKRSKELSHSLKTDYELLLRSTHEQIKGLNSSRSEIFARSLACLKVGANEDDDGYKSFGWISASIVLQEIDKCERSGERSSAAVAAAETSRIMAQREALARLNVQAGKAGLRA